MTGIRRIVILGCGYAGTAVARLARSRGLAVLANVRTEGRAALLRAAGFDVLQLARLDRSIETAVVDDDHVIVAFPPDGTTDETIAPFLDRAAAVTYVSSTGIYGERRGVVDDATPVAVSSPPNLRATRILAAEESYRRRGATVLRCPALYGKERGLHVRILRGEHQIPGDGTRYLSRIHVEDLAQIALASASSSSETFVVGDQEPARHVDVVRFVVDAYGVPMPPFVPLESVHESLRADRNIDGSRALSTFGVKLRYPSFREGMAPAATGIGPREAGGLPKGR